MLKQIRNLLATQEEVAGPGSDAIGADAAAAPPAPAYPPVQEPVRAEHNLIFREPKEFLTLSYGTPLDRHSAGKIVVFGLPKTGNVWTVSLLSDYTGLPPCHPLQDVDKPGVGMCHNPVSELLTDRADFLHGIYLVRDFRDLVVSYFHNGTTKWFKDDLPSYHYDDIEEFYFEWFLPRVVPYHDIHNHADGFMRYGVPIVRYEKMLLDTPRELSRLVKRLGLPYDEARIIAAVEKNKFENLQKTGVMLDRQVPTSHFRKGKHGGYRDELPTSVLRHINREFGDMLLRFGYILDEDV